MLDIIVFIGGIVLGVFIYWRESRSNTIFRAYNSFINKKETRMEVGDRKGFFFKRAVVYRILNALLLAAVIGVITYYTPLLNNHILQITLASFVGIIVGTYIAAALPTVKKAVDNPLEALQDVGEAGKEMISDLSNSAADKIKEKTASEKKEAPKPTEEAAPEKKETARERMKRKGYLK